MPKLYIDVNVKIFGFTSTVKEICFRKVKLLDASLSIRWLPIICLAVIYVPKFCLRQACMPKT